MMTPSLSSLSMDVADVENVIPTLLKNGIIIAQNALSTDSIERCLIEAQRHIEEADKALYNKDHRFDLLVPVDKFPSIKELEVVGPWVSLMKAMLGNDVVCDVSLVYSRPGATEQTWHADGPHIGKTADWSGKGQDKPYAICVFLPLISLNKIVGYTQFWPASHKYDELIGFGPVCPLLECELDGIVDVGSAVVYDYRLIHRGMPNKSEETERPLIQFLYHIPQYKEVSNYGKEQLF
eukprot:m.4721 g.4721  ORF g.4721 m.4721 type:complete len:237 (+) comp2281_c0_seq1:616-1326(+)